MSSIYISYGTAEDQVTALRLQAVAALHGLVAFVPPADTRGVKVMDLGLRSKIQECDVFMGVGVVGRGITPEDVCWQERDVALPLGKPMILTSRGPAPLGLISPDGMKHVVVLDPEQPDKAESDLVSFLERLQLNPATRRRLRALGTVALGLLMFAPQE